MLESNQKLTLCFPHQQAGFGNERLRWIKLLFFSHEIEDRFSAKKEAGVVFVDLTTADDTVWHRCFRCKTRVQNYCDWSYSLDEPFHDAFAQSQLHSRQWPWPQKKVTTPKRNDFSWGSSLAFLLFNIYSYDLLY